MHVCDICGRKAKSGVDEGGKVDEGEGLEECGVGWGSRPNEGGEIGGKREKGYWASREKTLVGNRVMGGISGGGLGELHGGDNTMTIVVPSSGGNAGEGAYRAVGAVRTDQETGCDDLARRERQDGPSSEINGGSLGPI